MKVEVNYNKVEVPDWLLKEVAGNKILAQILVNRGVDTLKKVKKFLNPDFYTPISYRDFPKIDRGVEFLLEAANLNKKVAVYGDYDCDGITATTILVELLEKLGIDTTYHLPDRFKEGYGMNKGVIKRLADDNIDLILTCDCGISNHEEIAFAKELGLDVIVTDHHQLPDQLPQADLILSPKLLPAEHPAYYLPGAGMAYYLAQAVLTEVGREDEVEEFLELVALAIVADVVPLQDENRYLLQIGQKALIKTKRLGLQELFKIAEIETGQLSVEDIGFQLTPRLNAPGRISSAQLGVELLLADTRKEARRLARELDIINEERKKKSNQIEEEAVLLLTDKVDGAVVLYQPTWHQGVIGIAAGRLCERFKVPALLMTMTDDGIITGSARSIPGVHIYEALQECKDLLDKFGGHAGAAGFSLSKEKLTLFSQNITRVLNENLKKRGVVREIKVDGELSFSQIDFDLYQSLKELAPFGEGNPTPQFITSDIEVTWQKSTRDGKHLRLKLSDEKIEHSAIWWQADGRRIDNMADVIYSIGYNDWQDGELQLVIKEVIKPKEEGDRKEDKLDLIIEDWRNWKEKNNYLPEFLKPIYYYEGQRKWPFNRLINRYQLDEIKDGKALVLLSLPPRLKDLREIISKLRPERLILAYSQRELKSGRVFLQELFKLVKKTVEDNKGQVGLSKLATLIGETEELIIVGLRYLQDSGVIEVQFIGSNTIFIKKGDNKKREGENKERLRELFKESRAFKKYMLDKNMSAIKRVIVE